VCERVLGPEHPYALATRNELARWTGRTGDAAGARDQYAALLPMRERVLDPEHQHTVATRDNLAYWTRQAAADSGSGVK
jgi:tetratricopeptide repeat protein